MNSDNSTDECNVHMRMGSHEMVQHSAMGDMATFQIQRCQKLFDIVERGLNWTRFNVANVRHNVG